MYIMCVYIQRKKETEMKSKTEIESLKKMSTIYKSLARLIKEKQRGHELAKFGMQNKHYR